MVRGQRRALAVEPRMSDSTGVSEITVQAYKSGKLSIRAFARGLKGGFVSGILELDVPDPPLDRIVFVDPDKKMVEGAKKSGADRIELYTEAYAKNFVKNPKKAVAPYNRVAEVANKLGIGINAGHDLNLENTAFFAQHIPQIPAHGFCSTLDQRASRHSHPESNSDVCPQK